MAWTPDHLPVALTGGWVDARNGRLTLTRQKVADLTLTTGLLIARDALMSGNERPFERRVAPGRYPFSLTLATLPGECEPRPVFAVIEFSAEETVRWEQALREGDNPDDLEPGECFGFAVDSWHAGYLDLEADLAQERMFTLHPNDDYLAKEHKAGLWNVHTFADTPANTITCRSGLGSGVYPSFWGLDAKGRPTCLVTDFSIIDDPMGREWPDGTIGPF